RRRLARRTVHWTQSPSERARAIAVLICCSNGPTDPMGLFAAFGSSLRLFDQLRRSSDTQPSVLRNSFPLRADSRHSGFDPGIFVRLETFCPGGRVGFHSGNPLVVLAQ